MHSTYLEHSLQPVPKSPTTLWQVFIELLSQPVYFLTASSITSNIPTPKIGRFKTTCLSVCETPSVNQTFSFLRTLVIATMKQGEALNSSVELSGSDDAATRFTEPSQANVQNRPGQLPEEDEIVFEESGGDDKSSHSDISISAASDSADEDTGRRDVAVEDLVDTRSDPVPVGRRHSITEMGNSKKRKPSDTESGTNKLLESTKKVKLGGDVATQSKAASSIPSDKSLLPAEIWHHIFTLTPPRTLGSLLQTNKLFHHYLAPCSSLQCHPPLPLAQGHTLVLHPDVIWQTSRRRYWPKMPTPLRDNPELDMWRLACVKKCQFCGKPTQDSSCSAPNKLNSGPGAEGVRVIWSFAVRACGACLMENSAKVSVRDANALRGLTLKQEIDLLLSSSMPSFLLPALPFVLVTNEMQVFSSGALENGLVPGNIPFTKIFLSKHVEGLKEEFSTVKALGPGTAEEWLKGLEDRGKNHRLDVARWEKWELAGGVLQMRTMHHPGEAISRSTQSSSSANSVSASASSGVPSRIPSAAESQSYGSYIPSFLDHNDSSSVISALLRMRSIKPPASCISSPDNADTGPFFRPQLPAQPVQQAHQPRLRTREEVLEMKTTRRKEIERRAMMLKPPLSPNILVHIPSFQAALQIPLPLDDSAWELLKPRLLAQRADAEQREHREQEISAHSRIIQERSEERRNLEGPSRESKELMDKDWDDAQAPLRAQISIYADETIRDGWDDGHKVNKDNSPRFAADVLLYVRKRFYAEMAKDSSAARAAGQEPLRDPPEGPYTQKLTLENMKWLFDTKIKPHTESFRKELFLCNGCEGNLKAYGFEGVIQHYAAKHTNALSLGSIVVHWRSEWPELPPFHPDPQSKSSQAVPPPAAGTFTQAAGPVPQYGFAPQPLGPSPHQAPPYLTSAPPPGYGGPPHTHQYGLPGYQVPQGIHTPSGMYPPPQHPYGQPYHQQAHYVTAYNAPPNDVPGPQGPHPAGMPPMPPHYSHPPGRNVAGPPPAGQYGHNYNAYQHNGHVGYPTAHAAPYGDKIRAQLEDLALNSREVWMATAGIKELPGNIRVYVVLHHLGKRYKSRFEESPPLAMFIDGLSNNKEMRPVRNVNGLMCKACHLGLGNRVHVEGERIAFSLPQLVNHFQHKHLEALQAMGAPLLDWTMDMVYVPDVSSLSNLRAMAGMDNHKHALITDAFPQMATYGHHSHQEALGHRDDYHGSHQGDPIPSSVRGYGNGQNDDLASAPPSQHSVSGQHVVAEYDPHRPGMYGAEGNAPESASHPPQVELVPSSVVYTPAPYVSQMLSHGGSGRTSPDVWQPPAGKHRSRKASAKDRRVLSSSKARKGSAKASLDILARAPAADEEDEEDKLAAEEAQRQEDAIRAMWAADRVEAARLASTSTAPQATQDADTNRDIPKIDVRDLSRTPMLREVPVKQFTRPKQSSRQPASPILISDREDDLFAGLESHLNQQQITATSQSRRQMPPSAEAYEMRAAYEAHPVHEGHVELRNRNSGREPPHASHGPFYDRSRSRSPVLVKYEEQTQSGYHRERSPAPRHVLPTYTRPAPLPGVLEPTYSTRPATRAYDEPYDRAPPRQVYRAYMDEDWPRVAPPPARHSDQYGAELRPRPALAHDQITEAYEVVLVRDSQGEYYIKRPIRHEPEPVYARFEDARPIYRHSGSHAAYEQERYHREPVYEGLPRHETITSRQSVYASPLRAANSGRQPAYEEVARPDASSFEEYDPRFPAAPPDSTEAPRYVRY
jgi:hypothetical protein